MASRYTFTLTVESEKAQKAMDILIGLAQLAGVDLSIEEKVKLRDMKPEEIHEIQEETNAKKSS